MLGNLHLLGKIPVDSAEDASHLHGILRAGQQGSTRRSGLSSNGAKKARTSGQDSVPYVVRCVANRPTGQKSWPSQVDGCCRRPS